MTRYLLLCLLCVSCSALDGPTAPASQVTSLSAAARPAERCVNVHAEGSAALGLVTACGEPGFGGLPFPVDIGGVSGLMSSVVITQQGQPQAAQHLTLRHCFSSSAGSFMTEDKAVCAPAGKDPAMCRVNDVLSIVSGDGVFANANGSLRNHGIIDFVASSLTFDIRGRVCGDGL